MYCKKCGNKIDDDSVFCFSCGAKIRIESSDKCIESTSTNSIFVSQTISHQSLKQEKTSCKKVLIALVAIALVFSIIISIIRYNKKKEEYLEAFETKISSYDYTMSYDIGTEFVTVTIIPKYDIQDFKFELVYTSPGLLRPYKEIHDILYAKAGEKFIYNQSLEFLDDTIASFEYVKLSSVSGLKQNKYAGSQEIVYNTECEFKFVLKQHFDDYILNCEIINNTNLTITELREFQILIEFENSEGNRAECDFYIPRLVLDEPLAPGSSVTIYDLRGNRSCSFSNHKAKGDYTSVSYSKQSYAVVYKSN